MKKEKVWYHWSDFPLISRIALILLNDPPKMVHRSTNEYNVSEISIYARDKYMEGRFDEVEAEYMFMRKRE